MLLLDFCGAADEDAAAAEADCDVPDGPSGSSLDVLKASFAPDMQLVLKLSSSAWKLNVTASPVPTTQRSVIMMDPVCGRSVQRL